jgi:hypothetical protein
MKNKKYYLKCEISKGMFSNERGVLFRDVNGRDISGFWPDGFIKNGFLEVKVSEFGKDKSLVWGPFPDCGGYGFFQGDGFYVNNELLTDNPHLAEARGETSERSHEHNL